MPGRNDLATSWAAFIAIAFDPWVLALLAIGAYFGWSASTAGSEGIRATLTILTSVAAGIVGGRATMKWTAQSEESALAARGNVSVRGLKLILGNISQIRARAQSHLQRARSDASEAQSLEILCVGIDEIVSRAGSLADEVISSIENWTDILPDANVKTQIGEIARLEDELKRLTNEENALQGRLADTVNQSVVEKAVLEERLAKTETTLAEVRRELTKRSQNLGLGVSGSVSPGLLATTWQNPTLPSSLVVGGSSIATAPMFQRTCERCNAKFNDPPHVVRLSNLCDKCAAEVQAGKP